MNNKEKRKVKSTRIWEDDRISFGAKSLYNCFCEHRDINSIVTLTTEKILEDTGIKNFITFEERRDILVKYGYIVVLPSIIVNDTEIKNRFLVNDLTDSGDSRAHVYNNKETKFKDSKELKDSKTINQKIHKETETLTMEIEAVVKGKIKPWGIAKLLRESCPEMIYKYLKYWKRFKSLMTNPIGYFIQAVIEQYEIPADLEKLKAKEGNKKARWGNGWMKRTYHDIMKPEKRDAGFDQRTYSDEFYESLYEDSNIKLCPD